MNWATAGQWTVIGIVIVVLYVLFASWIGRKLAAAERQTEEQEAWERRLKLARLLTIADEVEAAPEHERQRLYREAEALGFLDDDQPPRAA